MSHIGNVQLIYKSNISSRLILFVEIRNLGYLCHCETFVFLVDSEAELVSLNIQHAELPSQKEKWFRVGIYHALTHSFD